MILAGEILVHDVSNTCYYHFVHISRGELLELNPSRAVRDRHGLPQGHLCVWKAF